jgi:hypothetical protein
VGIEPSLFSHSYCTLLKSSCRLNLQLLQAQTWHLHIKLCIFHKEKREKWHVTMLLWQEKNGTVLISQVSGLGLKHAYVATKGIDMILHTLASGLMKSEFSVIHN